MTNHAKYLMLLVILTLSSLALGQDETSDTTDNPAGDGAAGSFDARPADPTFTQAVAAMQDKLEQSIVELNALRERIVREKIALNAKLRDEQTTLEQVRSEFQDISRSFDNRSLELTNLREKLKARKKEAEYLSGLFGEYVKNFEAGPLHIAEMQRYRKAIDEANLSTENDQLTQQQVFDAQLKLVSTSLDRLEDGLGGTSFEGSAVDDSGRVKQGRFVLVGPVAYFRSDDGQQVGTVAERLNSLEPTVYPFQQPQNTQVTDQLIANGIGQMPFDPTLGNARVIEETQDSIITHIKKGGPVMIPIFVLAGAAFLVALYKWLEMVLLRKPSRKKIRQMLDAVASRNKDAAVQHANKIGGPTGKMLQVGVDHIEEPRELVEEVMYEQVLSTRLKLQRFLPFIAISAASAPLLGLLGTVTGIINTFKLITVFGTGDVKTLSGGISEALITTEFGLIVAIPSLLIHAFLSRKAKGTVDNMEKAAVALVNQLSKTPYQENKSAA